MTLLLFINKTVNSSPIKMHCFSYPDTIFLIFLPKQIGSNFYSIFTSPLFSSSVIPIPKCSDMVQYLVFSWSVSLQEYLFKNYVTRFQTVYFYYRHTYRHTFLSILPSALVYFLIFRFFSHVFSSSGFLFFPYWKYLCCFVFFFIKAIHVHCNKYTYTKVICSHKFFVMPLYQR